MEYYNKFLLWSKRRQALQSIHAAKSNTLANILELLAVSRSIVLYKNDFAVNVQYKQVAIYFYHGTHTHTLRIVDGLYAVQLLYNNGFTVQQLAPKSILHRGGTTKKKQQFCDDTTIELPELIAYVQVEKPRTFSIIIGDYTLDGATIVEVSARILNFLLHSKNNYEYRTYTDSITGSHIYEQGTAITISTIRPIEDILRELLLDQEFKVDIFTTYAIYRRRVTCMRTDANYAINEIRNNLKNIPDKQLKNLNPAIGAFTALYRLTGIEALNSKAITEEYNNLSSLLLQPKKETAYYTTLLAKVIQLYHQVEDYLQLYYESTDKAISGMV